MLSFSHSRTKNIALEGIIVYMSSLHLKLFFLVVPAGAIKERGKAGMKKQQLENTLAEKGFLTMAS